MKSQLMTQAELARLQASGKTLEQDERGIKVTLLLDGNILKVFRLRRWFTSGFLFSNAKRFCRNALRLEKFGILTVKIIALHHVQGSTVKAVLYAPLAGSTVRETLKTAKLNQQSIEKIGTFFAKLHYLGIYFRSLHLGNVVLTPAGELGLIDIADMRIYPWTLFLSTRLRNFKHLYRYKNDVALLQNEEWIIFINAYLKASGLNKKQQSLGKQALYPHFGLKKLT